jgi:hypothetical protein
MNLPERPQVDAAFRYAVVIVGTTVTLLGLQNRGIYLDQIKVVIKDLGEVANSTLTFLSSAAAVYAAYRGFNASSLASQSAALEKQGAVVVTTPEIAAATPDSPNVVSHADVMIMAVSK